MRAFCRGTLSASLLHSASQSHFHSTLLLPHEPHLQLQVLPLHVTPPSSTNTRSHTATLERSIERLNPSDICQVHGETWCSGSTGLRVLGKRLSIRVGARVRKVRPRFSRDIWDKGEVWRTADRSNSLQALPQRFCDDCLIFHGCARFNDAMADRVKKKKLKATYDNPIMGPRGPVCKQK